MRIMENGGGKRYRRTYGNDRYDQPKTHHVNCAVAETMLVDLKKEAARLKITDSEWQRRAFKAALES